MQDYLGRPIDLKPFKPTFLVCAAVTMILPMLTFVLWTTMEAPEGELVTPPTWEVLLFALVALAGVAMAPYVRGLLLRSTAVLKSNTGQVLEGEQAATGRVTQAAIVGMAMCEMPLLLGFVLGFMSGSWAYYVSFAALTVVGWTLMFPRPSQIRAWYAQQMGYEPIPGTTL